MIMFLIGSIAGVLIMRAFFLDFIQIMGWELFWNDLSDSKIMDAEMIFKSKTFLKCFAGGAVGGILGAILGNAIETQMDVKGIET